MFLAFLSLLICLFGSIVCFLLFILFSFCLFRVFYAFFLLVVRLFVYLFICFSLLPF